MRDATCASLIDLFENCPYVFLTGDLGFMALEPLQMAIGNRFVNAGVAEQNMVSVAAGIASTGIPTWVYSIAPFIYARSFEQIRNDVCLHNFDVKLIGNGGGYGYGSMGASHHGLEDYGILLTLQNMRGYVPAFKEDVGPIIRQMAALRGPAYLRLGRCEKPLDFALPDYAPWRRLLVGGGGVLVAVGSLAGTIISGIAAMAPGSRPSLWVVSELPVMADTLPSELVFELRTCGRLVVVEEHVAQGSVGHMLATAVLQLGISVTEFRHHHARGYPSGLSGSQVFHRKECELDAGSILAWF